MTQSLEYKPSFLQKFLGKNYKWWYLFLYNIKVVKASITADILYQLGLIINTTLIIIVWIKSFPGKEILTYLLIGRLVKTLTDNFWYNRIGDDISSGRITTHLLKPQDYFWFHLTSSFGARLIRNLLSFVAVATVLIGFLVFRIEFVFSLNIIYSILLLPIAFFINYCLVFLVGMINFFITNKRDFFTVTDNYNVLATIFVGSVIPLNQLPFQQFFEALPFSYILHHPMQIYLGKYSALETFYVFLGGIAWCIVLYFLAKFVFKMGLKRNESVGL